LLLLNSSRLDFTAIVLVHFCFTGCYLVWFLVVLVFLDWCIFFSFDIMCIASIYELPGLCHEPCVHCPWLTTSMLPLYLVIEPVSCTLAMFLELVHLHYTHTHMCVCVYEYVVAFVIPWCFTVAFFSGFCNACTPFCLCSLVDWLCELASMYACYVVLYTCTLYM